MKALFRKIIDAIKDDYRKGTRCPDCMRILLAFKLSGDRYSRTPQMSINVPPNALILSKRVIQNNLNKRPRPS